MAAAVVPATWINLMEIIVTQKGTRNELSVPYPYILHRKGSEDYPTIRIISNGDPVDFEVLSEQEQHDALLAKYRATEYKRRLVEAIRARYDIDDEIALAANMASPMLLADEDKAQQVAEEYQAYQDYRAECKTRIKTEIESITEIPEDTFEP